METRFKTCIFSAVFVLLAVAFLSQAYAFDDDVKVISSGKQIANISPQPTIDCGEPGDDPHLRTLTVQSVGSGGVPDAQVTQDSGARRRDASNRFMVLWRFFFLRIRQLFL
jgi:hypothetical protein